MRSVQNKGRDVLILYIAKHSYSLPEESKFIYLCEFKKQPETSVELCSTYPSKTINAWTIRSSLNYSMLKNILEKIISGLLVCLFVLISPHPVVTSLQKKTPKKGKVVLDLRIQKRKPAANLKWLKFKKLQNGMGHLFFLPQFFNFYFPYLQ